jgi:hypothetical protein
MYVAIGSLAVAERIHTVTDPASLTFCCARAAADQGCTWCVCCVRPRPVLSVLQIALEAIDEEVRNEAHHISHRYH